MNNNESTATVVNANAYQGEDGFYAYAVYAVNRFRIVSETTVYAHSANDVVEHFLGMGYVKVEVAPAVPVNGYPDGLPVKRGDVASGTR